MVDELDVPEEGLQGSRISRRKVLIGAGVVGGTVWVAPVIDSFTSAAAAASEPITSSCNGATCANLTSCNGNDSCYCYERAETFYGVRDEPGVRGPHSLHHPKRLPIGNDVRREHLALRGGRSLHRLHGRLPPRSARQFVTRVPSPTPRRQPGQKVFGRPGCPADGRQRLRSYRSRTRS